MNEQNNPILEVKNLRVSYHTYAGEVKAVRGVQFSLEKGQALAIVGESGCGKSVTAKSIMGLIKAPQGEIKENSEILYHGENILKYQAFVKVAELGSITKAASVQSFSRMRWLP